MSKIEWTNRTWNPSVGCDKISEGCQNCYENTQNISNGFKFNLMPQRLDQPIKRKKPTIYFINSMSDLFHENMSYTYLDKIFKVIEKTPWHTYQILTKRASRMQEYLKEKNCLKI